MRALRPVERSPKVYGAVVDFIESLRDSVDRFSLAVRSGPLDAPVAGCPGWDLAELTRHLGFVHRWARLAAATMVPPDRSGIEAAPGDISQLGEWFDTGAASLIDVLSRLDPEAPTWHPFDVPMLAAVWPRRQAHEALIHAWDAEQAIAGVSTPMDPSMAADGIAEYFEVIIPRVISRDGRVVPVGTLAVNCTDAGTRLVVRSEANIVTIDPAAAVQAELTGTADALSLALWGRRPLTSPPTHPLTQAWLDFGGS